jgi:uncharacterized integral membrane protein/uncharacterized coiled-coil protein SlyX
MNLRTLLMVVSLALFSGFVAFNWSVITAPTTLSFAFWTAQAPLGLLLLGFTVLIAAMFLLLLAVQQATVLVETRRAAKELTAQRALADQAEASRFTALSQHLDEELRRLEAQAAARQDALAQRLNDLEQALREHIDQASNSLAAFIGELDDRVERMEAARDAAPPSA